MKLTSVVLFAAAFRGSAGQTSDQTNIFERTPRVVGGQLSRPGDYPFFAHALDGQLCGGTLISPDVVLTAASCQTAFGNEVIIGSSDLFGRDEGVERISVEMQYPHPFYSEGKKDNDIMLVLLAEPSTSPVVSLQDQMEAPPQGQDVTVVGFGRSSPQGNVAIKLKDVQMQVIGLEICRSSVHDTLVADSYLCAGGSTTGKDSCSGDVGGPLLDSDTKRQYGVVGDNPGCGKDGPGIYTRVSFYADWINGFLCDQSSVKPDDCGTEPGQEPAQQPAQEPGTESPVSPSQEMEAASKSKGKKSKRTSMDSENASTVVPSGLYTQAPSDSGEGVPTSSKPGKKSRKSSSPSGKKISGKKATSGEMIEPVQPSNNSTQGGEEMPGDGMSNADDTSASKGKKGGNSDMTHRQKKRAKQRRKKRAQKFRINNRRFPVPKKT